jgi:hypothetical protein
VNLRALRNDRTSLDWLSDFRLLRSYLFGAVNLK